MIGDIVDEGLLAMVGIDDFGTVAGRIVGIADPSEEFFDDRYQLASGVLGAGLFSVLASRFDGTSGKVVDRVG